MMTATERFAAEIALLRARYEAIETQGEWVRIPDYPLPEGWNRTTTDVAFRIVPAPGAPYGIVVPAGLQFRQQKPNNYSEPVQGIPFPGTWGQFSWAPDGEWRPGTSPQTGTNYLNWVIGIAL